MLDADNFIADRKILTHLMEERKLALSVTHDCYLLALLLTGTVTYCDCNLLWL